MSRPRLVEPPVMTLDSALETARRVKRRREEAKDPDLVYFTPTLNDDDDIDHVVAYLAVSWASSSRATHQELFRAELQDRARLIEYLHQREVQRHKRRLLAVLESAYELGEPATSYGSILGLPTRGAVRNRRRALADEGFRE